MLITEHQLQIIYSLMEVLIYFQTPAYLMYSQVMPLTHGSISQPGGYKHALGF